MRELGRGRIDCSEGNGHQNTKYNNMYKVFSFLSIDEDKIWSPTYSSNEPGSERTWLSRGGDLCVQDYDFGGDRAVVHGGHEGGQVQGRDEVGRPRAPVLGGEGEDGGARHAARHSLTCIGRPLCKIL